MGGDQGRGGRRSAPEMGRLRRRIAELETLRAECERARDELRRVTAELEGIFRALPDLYFRLDSEGRFLDYRAGRTASLYAPPETFLGRKADEVLPPRVASVLLEAIREALRTDSAVAVEYSLPKPPGEQVFDARIAPLPDDQVVAVVRDITERARAEEALRESEERYRMLAEAARDMIFIIGGDDRSRHRPAVHGGALLPAVEERSGRLRGGAGARHHRAKGSRAAAGRVPLPHLPVSNALKYSPPDTPVVIRVARSDGEALVSVTDQGVGIPPEEMPRLFQRFYRVAGGRRGEGLGLGLYMSRLIVDAHGGRIWAESEPGKGSTFSFTLPSAP